MTGLLSDIRYALKQLRKSPAFTAVAAGTLALGIGATTLVFTCVESFMLKPLPFPQPDQLTLLKQVPRGDARPLSLSWPDYQDWRQNSKSFASMGAAQIDTYSLTGSDQAERVRGIRVNSDYFRTLGVKAQMGRVFTATEDEATADPVVMLSDDFWQRRYNRSPDVVGRSLEVDGRPHTIIGIAPAHLRIPMGFTEIFTPLAPVVVNANRSDHRLLVLGRLRDGITAESASKELSALAKRLEEQYPASNRDLGAAAWDLHRTLSNVPRRALTVLMLAVVLVLLICCVNIANLLMARGAGRAREMAVRGALGASRRRLVRQLLLESGVLALVGGAGGLLIARWGVDVFRSSLPGPMLPAGGLEMDQTVVGFTLLLSLGTCLIFGLAPAFRVVRSGAPDTLKEGARGGATTVSRSRLANIMVAGELSMAVLLLTSAGLVIASLSKLHNQNLNFQPQGVLTAEVAFRAERYKAPAQRVLLMENILRAMRTLPGAQAVAATTFPPMTSDQSRSYAAEGRLPGADEQAPTTAFQSSTPEYAKAIGARMVKGRFFTEQDTANSEPVAVISESLARIAFPGTDPMGRRIAIYSAPGKLMPWMRVVGVTADLRTLARGDKPMPELFVPFAQHPQDSLYLVMRTSADPAGLTHALQTAIESVDKDLPLNLIRSMERVMSDSLVTARVISSMMSIFATLALLLAAMGLFGVVAYLVATRTHEFGVRLALGASARSLLRLVLGRALVLCGIGCGIGLVAGVGAAGVLRALLFETVQPDPLIFAAVAGLLGIVALVASWVPLRRALALDPVRALHMD